MACFSKTPAHKFNINTYNVAAILDLEVTTQFLKGSLCSHTLEWKSIPHLFVQVMVSAGTDGWKKAISNSSSCLSSQDNKGGIKRESTSKCAKLTEMLRLEDSLCHFYNSETCESEQNQPPQRKNKNKVRFTWIPHRNSCSTAASSGTEGHMKVHLHTKDEGRMFPVSVSIIIS